MEENNYNVEDEELVDDTTISSEEDIQQSLKIDKNNFTIDIGVIKLNDCLPPEPLKQSRKKTYIGLTQSVSELGILTPIHVMVSEGFSDYVDEGGDPDDYDGIRYILLDGFRRMYAGLKVGLKTCNAVIWDFKDKELGSELSTTISLVLNKDQRHNWEEIWYLMGILEMRSPLSPGTLEYLLQLESGDAMKLKEIMQRAEDFPEPKEDLLSNKKNINQCFQALQKMMKEQDQLLKEDTLGISEVEQGDEVIDSSEEQGTRKELSDEEVRDILEMEDGSEELGEDDFDENIGYDVDSEPERQKVGERHELSRELKAETMMRDNYTCQCCGLGKEMSMFERMGVLQSHHIISVANSGPDTKENITTLCMTCHTLVHLTIRAGLKMGISKEEFEGMSEESQEMHKKIRNLAKRDYNAAKKLGKNPQKIREDNKDYYKFKMPGSDLSANKAALEEYKESGAIDSDEL